MGLALLFPGQGTQHADALPWLAAQPEAQGVLARLAATVGADWRARLADAAWASANRVAQPLVTGLSLAAWACMAHRLPPPAVLAGYSVGELAACSAGGAFDAATALALAVDRADAMDRSTTGRATGLLAVHGLAGPALDEACERHALAVAIRVNGESHILGGEAGPLDAAEHEFASRGLRCNRLPIQVASHTPWMADAAAAFEARLQRVPFGALRAPLVANFGAHAVRDAGRLRAGLARQIDHPIAWDACMDTLRERGVHCVLEMGPGTSLARMWQARFPEIPARSVDEFGSPEAAAAWVVRQSGD